MNTVEYVIYRPTEPGTPFLLVGFAVDGTPTNVFRCDDRKAAKRLRRELKARADIHQELRVA